MYRPEFACPTMNQPPAVEIQDVRFRYGSHQALAGVSLAIRPAEIFVFLGPNGSGKTTLFRLLSTLIPPQEGTIRILGYDVAAQAAQVRRRIGVVFQAASVDGKLSVWENLRHQGWLYGLRGKQLRDRAAELMDQLGLADRRDQTVETLSGGLRRRVELAKGLLHHPRVLLMDEPSTGLDPAARSDLWNYLNRIRREQEVTVVMTTHLLEEAEKADRLAILDRGRLVALDAPGTLRSQIGGDIISIECDEPDQVARVIREQLELQPQVIDHTVRLEHPEGPRLVAQLAPLVQEHARSITVGKPTLEDVFIQRTGHRFWGSAEAAKPAAEESEQ